VGPSLAQSQGYSWNRAEITPVIGYQFGGKIGVREGDLTIKDEIDFGILLDLTLRPGAQLEFMYTRQPTVLRLKDAFFGSTRELFDMAVEYYHVGGVYEVYRGDNIKPYGVMSLGFTHFSPQDAKYSSEWRFSMSFGGGVKVFPTRRVGLRLEGRLLTPFISGGSGFWCSAPGGCFVSLGGTAVLQVSLSAGLILAF
jgi:opacity protein-like surface antigen